MEAIRTGLEVGITYDGPIRIPIRLRLGTNVDAGRLGELPLPSAAGGLVPLSHLADVKPATTAILVNHQDGERRLLVGFNVRGADLGAVVARAQARVTQTVRTPARVTGSSGADSTRTFKRRRADSLSSFRWSSS